MAATRRRNRVSCGFLAHKAVVCIAMRCLLTRDQGRSEDCDQPTEKESQALTVGCDLAVWNCMMLELQCGYLAINNQKADSKLIGSEPALRPASV